MPLRTGQNENAIVDEFGGEKRRIGPATIHARQNCSHGPPRVHPVRRESALRDAPTTAAYALDTLAQTSDERGGYSACVFVQKWALMSRGYSNRFAPSREPSRGVDRPGGGGSA